MSHLEEIVDQQAFTLTIHSEIFDAILSRLEAVEETALNSVLVIELSDDALASLVGESSCTCGPGMACSDCPLDYPAGADNYAGNEHPCTSCDCVTADQCVLNKEPQPEPESVQCGVLDCTDCYPEENVAGYPYGEFDAVNWAREFIRLFGHRRYEIDEDLMIGWFANALMTGWDASRSESANECSQDPASDYEESPRRQELIEFLVSVVNDDKKNTQTRVETALALIDRGL